MPDTPFHWECPYCGRDTTITSADYHSQSCRVGVGPNDVYNEYEIETVRCPSPDCSRYTLQITEYDTAHAPATGRHRVNRLGKWHLRPEAKSKPFPDFIPEQLRSTYGDACRVVDLAPHASAAMARKCLQGMIRHRWGVTDQKNLAREIEAIEDKVNPLTWQAIDAVRSVGNVSAHMEKDVDLLIPIDPGEAELLIGLIETLFQDWYVAERARQERLQRVADLATEKQALRDRASD